MTAINWSNVTDFTGIVSSANTSSNGSFWVGMLYMAWIVLLFILIGYGFEVALTISAFLALVMGLLLVYADLIAFKWILVFIGILLTMILYIIWSSGKVKQGA